MTENEAQSFQSRIEELKRDLTFELQRRERPDRHPYQIGCLVGLLVVSAVQAIIGVPPGSALNGIATHATIVAIDVTFVVGSILCLWGAILGRDKHFELSVRTGVYGHFSIFFGCLAYTGLVIASTEPRFSEKPYWLAVTSIGLTVGIAYASVLRWQQMRMLLRAWRARRQS